MLSHESCTGLKALGMTHVIIGNTTQSRSMLFVRTGLSEFVCPRCAQSSQGVVNAVPHRTCAKDATFVITNASRQA